MIKRVKLKRSRRAARENAARGVRTREWSGIPIANPVRASGPAGKVAALATDANDHVVKPFGAAATTARPLFERL